ncbi:hypothetical protein V8E36_009534 [Tilletia maclaganii]
MGSLFSKPITTQVENGALRGAELYERGCRAAAHLLDLFFIPLLNSPISLSNYARSRRSASARAGMGGLLPTHDSCMSGLSCAASRRVYPHARLAELGNQHHGLKRVTSNASRSSRTSAMGGVGSHGYQSPYSLAGIKANRETIERRRARAELAAAGIDVQLHRRNSARSSTPTPTTESPVTPSFPPAPAPPKPNRKRQSMPVRSVLTPALEPTPRVQPVRRQSARRVQV